VVYTIVCIKENIWEFSQRVASFKRNRYPGCCIMISKSKKLILTFVIILALAATKASAMYVYSAPYITKQQLADLKEKSDHGDIKAARKLASLYISSFVLTPCVDSSGAATFRLGTENCSTKSVPVDYSETFKYMKLVADTGDAWAQTYMGWFYDHGKVVNQDYKTALHWYRLAAKQGYPYAQDLIGRMYRDGHGVSRNYFTAVEYFKKSALQHTSSNSRLALLYATGGPGFPRDYEKAVFWHYIDAPGWGQLDESLLVSQDKDEDFGLLIFADQNLTPEQHKKVIKQISDYKMPPPTKWTPKGSRGGWFDSSAKQPSVQYNLQR